MVPTGTSTQLIAANHFHIAHNWHYQIIFHTNILIIITVIRPQQPSSRIEIWHILETKRLQWFTQLTYLGNNTSENSPQWSLVRFLQFEFVDLELAHLGLYPLLWWHLFLHVRNLTWRIMIELRASSQTTRTCSGPYQTTIASTLICSGTLGAFSSTLTTRTCPLAWNDSSTTFSLPSSACGPDLPQIDVFGLERVSILIISYINNGLWAKAYRWQLFF